jgi:tight adherence protein C
MNILAANDAFWLTASIFVATTVLVMLLGSLVRPDDRRMLQRLGDSTSRAAGPSPGSGAAKRLVAGAVHTLDARLLPGDANRSRIRSRLARAGIYSPQAVSNFVAAQLLLSLLPLGACLAGGFFGVIAWSWAASAGASAGAAGMVLPGLWLDRRAARRQVGFARSLPDFLDLLVACLESGLSLQAALQQVATELRVAHPVLYREMSIVQREIELGSLPHAALRHFAERSGTESVRSLSTIVEQSQRFGTTLADAFRVHAETLRIEREQRAEEHAQRAAVKILFPTLLLIFPAIFVVLAGPAAVQIYQHFTRPGSTIAPEAGP